MNKAHPAGLFFLTVFIGVVLSVSLLFVDNLMPNGLQQTSIVLAALAPALLLAAFDSDWLMPYVLLIWVIAPEIRRLFDWSIDHYQAITILSLIPILVTVSLIPRVIRGSQMWPGRIKTAAALIGVALAAASLVGIFRNGSSALFALAQRAPLLIILYAASTGYKPETYKRWVTSFLVLVAGASMYGVVQYVLAPPWDVFWMRFAPMNSIGQPFAYKIRVFSTLNSPAPLAWAIAVGLLLTIAATHIKVLMRVVLAMALMPGLLLSQLRSAWVFAILSIALVVLFGTGGSRRLAMAAIVAVVLLGGAFVAFGPGGGALQARLSTLGNAENDDSLRERAITNAQFLARIVSSPQGEGLGSVGDALKTAGVRGTKDVRQRAGYNALDTDNGLLTLVIAYGVLGAGAFIGGILLIGGTILQHARVLDDSAFFVGSMIVVSVPMLWMIGIWDGPPSLGLCLASGLGILQLKRIAPKLVKGGGGRSKFAFDT